MEKPERLGSSKTINRHDSSNVKRVIQVYLIQITYTKWQKKNQKDFFLFVYLIKSIYFFIISTTNRIIDTNCKVIAKLKYILCGELQMRTIV